MPTFARLRSQIMRWANDNADAVAKAKPGIPPGFYNRRRANWKPLLAIAERDLKKNQAAFAETARQIDPKRAPLDVLKVIEADHPAPEKLLATTQAELSGLMEKVCKVAAGMNKPS